MAVRGGKNAGLRLAMKHTFGMEKYGKLRPAGDAGDGAAVFTVFSEKRRIDISPPPGRIPCDKGPPEPGGRGRGKRFMPKLSGKLLRAFVLTTLAGACLHFLYALLPNPVTAVLSPVNESLWEHGKLLLWPYLAAMAVLTRNGPPGSRTPWLLTAPGLVAAMLAAGWVYHVVLGGEALAVDVGIYVVLMALGFLFSELLDGTREYALVGTLAVLAVLALAAAMVLFTFLPPEHPLFLERAVVNTWSTIPY